MCNVRHPRYSLTSDLRTYRQTENSASRSVIGICVLHRAVPLFHLGAHHKACRESKTVSNDCSPPVLFHPSTALHASAETLFRLCLFCNEDCDFNYSLVERSQGHGTWRGGGVDIHCAVAEVPRLPGNPPVDPPPGAAFLLSLTCFSLVININMVTISCIPRGPITEIEAQISTLLRALPRLFVTVVWSRSLFDQLLRASAWLSRTNPRITHTPRSHKYTFDGAEGMSHAHGTFAQVAHTTPCQTLLFLSQLADPCLFSEQPWWKHQDKSFTGC